MKAVFRTSFLRDVRKIRDRQEGARFFGLFSHTLQRCSAKKPDIR